ncbi:MAG: hypothetical protein KC609_21650 [Myxococcales bacterium]|nr:hypothetical protein [Myxococcales bacterium]
MSAAEREGRIAAGLDRFEDQLYDWIGHGLAYLSRRPQELESAAAALVDAQAGGLASQLRRLSEDPRDGDGWPARLLERLSSLHLALRAYRVQESIEPSLRAELRRMVGWHATRASLASEARETDRYFVLGRALHDDEPIRSQRIWLCGRRSGRYALLLEFAYAGRAFEWKMTPGTLRELELVYYPAAVPLRAAVFESEAATGRRRAAPRFRAADLSAVCGCVDELREAAALFAAALARNPWIECIPLRLQNVVAVVVDERPLLCDRFGACVAVDERCRGIWELVALGGGGAVDCFGEWRGDAFWPLSLCVDGRFVSLSDGG